MVFIESIETEQIKLAEQLLFGITGQQAKFLIDIVDVSGFADFCNYGFFIYQFFVLPQQFMLTVEFGF